MYSSGEWHVSGKLCFSDLKVQLFQQLRPQVQLGNERMRFVIVTVRFFDYAHEHEHES